MKTGQEFSRNALRLPRLVPQELSETCIQTSDDVAPQRAPCRVSGLLKEVEERAVTASSSAARWEARSRQRPC
jgi:hypothetical protein